MIINPMFFYLMNACDNAQTAAVILSIISGFAWSGMIIAYLLGWVDGNWEYDDEEIKPFKKLIKLTGYIFACAVVACILIPYKETLLLMQAAKLATTDNVNAVFESLKAAMDYAITILQ